MLGCHTELYNEGGIDEQPEVAPRVTSTRRRDLKGTLVPLNDIEESPILYYLSQNEGNI